MLFSACAMLSRVWQMDQCEEVSSTVSVQPCELLMDNIVGEQEKREKISIKEEERTEYLYQPRFQVKPYN